jgi:hypothetical protein
VSLGARRAVVVALAELHQLLPDHQAGVIQVEVSPTQTEGLTPPQAGGRDHLEQRTEPVVGDVIEKPAELAGLQRLDLRPLAGLQPGQPGRIREHQALPLGIGQGAAQSGPDPLGGGRVQTEHREHGLDVVPPELADLDPAQVRDQVVGDVLDVAPASGRPQVPLAVQPLGEEGPQRDLADGINPAGLQAPRRPDGGHGLRLGGVTRAVELPALPVRAGLQFDSGEPGAMRWVP